MSKYKWFNDIATGVASELIADEIIKGKENHQGVDYNFDLMLPSERIELNQIFAEQIDNLPAGQGLLVQVFKFEDRVGNPKNAAPVILGQSDAPHKPFLDVYQKRAEISKFGKEILDNLRDNNLTATGHDYFWISKSPNGSVNIYETDEQKMHTTAFNMMAKLQLQADYAQNLGPVKKMVEQSTQFLMLEREYAQEIAQKGLRAKLSALSSKMYQAEQKFKKAASDRQKAFEKMQKVSFLQKLNKIAGVVSGLTGAMSNLTAQRDYAQSESERARVEYNTNVSIYNQTIIMAVPQNQAPATPEIGPLPPLH
ncbi:MAG: hypothetical protein AAF558_10075 [Verrucomicrobiota bacterium]